MSSALHTAKDEIVCHCLQIRASQIEDAVQFQGSETLRKVMETTEAGTGCTGCHRKICRLLSNHSTSDTSDSKE